MFSPEIFSIFVAYRKLSSYLANTHIPFLRSWFATIGVMSAVWRMSHIWSSIYLTNAQAVKNRVHVCHCAYNTVISKFKLGYPTSKYRDRMAASPRSCQRPTVGMTTIQLSRVCPATNRTMINRVLPWPNFPRTDIRKSTSPQPETNKNNGGPLKHFMFVVRLSINKIPGGSSSMGNVMLNKSGVKCQNTLDCLEQYTCIGLRLWHSRHIWSSLDMYIYMLQHAI